MKKGVKVIKSVRENNQALNMTLFVEMQVKIQESVDTYNFLKHPLLRGVNQNAHILNWPRL